MDHHRKHAVSPDSALASDIFDQFCSANTFKSILGLFRHLCDILHIKPTTFPQFYPKLKAKLRSWKAQALWSKFDKRASHKCYNRGKACPNTRVLIIGCGPCGLRAAIEAQLLGAKVVIIEKRDRISRNNVLHLWPFVIQDLRALGAKKFFGKFCAGSIDHISIRQLQCILLKVALIFGVELYEGVSFESLLPPPDDQSNERIGWRALTNPSDHPVSQYEFDVLIGADGRRNTLEGFRRKEFRGKLAIAITANFINRRTEAEARVEEISGVAFIFNQKFFKDLYAATGIDLENIVYYKDETHYFVMTAKKHSLIDKGVILNDYSDTAKLLGVDNVDKDALEEYAREAADFSTNYRLPQLEFAVNHYGQPDVAMFDFTSMYAAENASRVVERNGHRLLMTLVGDSLLEPFWPTGSGCARGFLSSMDACWAVRSWGSGTNPLEVLAERESIYRILAQTTPENLHRDLAGYTLDPHTRYPNLNNRCVVPIQVKGLYNSDNLSSVEQYLKSPSMPVHDVPKKRRRRDSQVHPDTLLLWLKKQVALYDNVHIEDMTNSFKDGLALCAIIHHYRPDLIDFHSLRPCDVAKNNQLAFDILERELGVPPVMTGLEMEQCEVPDKLAMLSYLSQIYDSFRGEIPHIKHPKLDDVELKLAEEDEEAKIAARLRNLAQLTTSQKVSLLGRLANPSRKRASNSLPRTDTSARRARKRRSGASEKDKLSATLDREDRLGQEIKRGEPHEDFSGRIKNLEAKLKGTSMDKKPKDLLRAIGKIEKTDWNVKEIEKKIAENKYGRGIRARTERVPKWSRQQFDDKFSAMERKLKVKDSGNEENKYVEIDVSLKQLERKLKEGAVLEQGQRGANKVSAMAAHLTSLSQEAEKPAIQKSNSKTALVLPSQGGSEICHFCKKRVYLMERLSAEGRFFHRGCFRCEYCSTTLRLGNYAFDRDGKFGSRFFCTQHFGLPGTQRLRMLMKSDALRLGGNKENIPASNETAQTPKAGIQLTAELDDLDRGTTPERIEFENLSNVAGDAASDLEDAEISEMDEDEWTDRNFGASTAEASSDEVSDLSSDSEEGEEEFAEALDVGVGMTADETLRLAENWTRRHSQEPPRNDDTAGDTNNVIDDDGSGSCHDSDDSRNHISYQEYDSEDDDSETATEGEEEVRARELRKQEVHLQVPDRNSDSGSDTEVASDEYLTSSGSDEETEEDVENSATEIETDSEFEHDGTTPTRHDVPDIIISESVHVKRGLLEEPRRVQVLEKPLNGKLTTAHVDSSKPDYTPPLQEKRNINQSSFLNHFDGSTPLINPRRGDYFLNRTHSTEGIASKISLELKKRYLLGSDSASGSVKKSGSASTLDSKFKSFVDQITEHQKLLNPAPEPSPTMQAFLQGADKLRTSPTVTSVQQLIRKQKDLPGVSDFSHICSLRNEKESLASETNAGTDKSKLGSISKTDLKSSKDEDKAISQENENECRPRSPAHETSIVVPEFLLSQVKPEIEADVETDSLSSDSSLSEDSNHEDHGKVATIPPKVEIHNSRGELMEEEGCNDEQKVLMSELLDSASPLENLGVNSDNIPTKVKDLNHIIDTSKTDLIPGRTYKGGEACNTVLLSSENMKFIQAGNALRHDIQEIILPSSYSQLDYKTSGQSSPSSPVSVKDEESFRNESTLAALTETELSDWARDEDAVVSENLEDLEFSINPQFITFRKHQKPKTRRTARGVAAKIARTEDFDEEYSHICGKTDRSVAPSSVLLNTENIEFMDTGGEDDNNADDYGAKNIKNSGYVQFMSPVGDGYEDATPNNEDIPESVELSNESEAPKEVSYGELTEDATTTASNSEAVTVMDSPVDAQRAVEDNVIQNYDISSKVYEDYVRRLQGRISPFSNVRDSIDIRKSRKNSGKFNSTNQQQISEEGEQIKGNVNIKSPTTARKLEEISQERSKQKELIHEMVLQKLMAQGRSPQERRNKRNSRDSTPSNSGPGSQNSLRSLSKDDIEKPDLETINTKSCDKPSSFISPDKQSKIHNIISFKEKEIEKCCDNVTTPDNSNKDLYTTPMTSFKQQAVLKKSRPVSVHSLGEQSRLDKNSLSVAVSLSNQDTSSLPNIPKALSESDGVFETPDGRFETPVPPPRTKSSSERDQARMNARARVRLMSDEELGLSPEERIKILKEKVARKIGRSESEPSSVLSENVHSDSVRTSNTEPLLNQNLNVMKPSASTSPSNITDDSADTPIELSISSSPEPSKQQSNISSAPNKSDLPSDKSSVLKVPSSLEVPVQGKKSKDRERRKSIIQAVSDFFHKKSPTSTTLSKSTSPVHPSQSGSKFGKFRIHKSKDKYKENVSLSKEELTPKSKNMSEAGARRRLIDESPPVPPPPINYVPLHRSSDLLFQQAEESLSEADAEDDSRVSHALVDAEAAAAKKKLRMSRRIERQAQLKRLRMAQEIQRQLEELEVKQRELERRGVHVEKAIRGEDSGGGIEETQLLKEWFELMRERCELRRYERELMVRAQEMELEDRHARLQHELRESLAKDDKMKTSEEVAKEGHILREMLEIVERRDSLHALLEEDRKRYKEEDKDLEAQMLAKGLRLTPFRNTEPKL